MSQNTSYAVVFWQWSFKREGQKTDRQINVNNKKLFMILINKYLKVLPTRSCFEEAILAGK